MSIKEFEKIPPELKACKNWVARVDKIPINPHTLYGAKANEPSSWGTFEQAAAAVGRKTPRGQTCNGIGFELSAPYCGIDIDHCRNPQTGELTAEALDIIERMDSYTEVSPSGTGIHILYINDGNRHTEWHKKKTIDEVQHIEMYQCDRYFTVTGNVYGNYNTLAERSKWAELIYTAYMQDEQQPTIADSTAEQPKQTGFRLTAPQELTDGEIIEKAMNAKNGGDFTALWRGDTSAYGGDESGADLALCNMLAFWSGGNADTIDRLFRQSGLMRDKWDRKTGQSTYGNITINKALSNGGSFYNPLYSAEQAVQDFKNSIRQEQANEDMNTAAALEVQSFTYEDMKKYKADDIGTARFFADLTKAFILYVAPQKRFYIYNGVIWEEDNTGDNPRTGKILMKFVETAQALIPPKPKGEPKRWTDEEAAEECINSLYRKQYSYLSCVSGRDRIIKDVKKLLQKSADIFNSNPELFNTKNCTINLNTGEAQPHKATDYITYCATCDYIPGAICERFNSFIDEITEGNEDTKKALQSALGYALLGKAPEECLFIAYGPRTRNGKGTLFNTVLTVMGSYGKQISFDTLARSNNFDGSKPTPDLAAIRGKRFLLANEPQKGVCFNEGLVKQLTGNDVIVARFLNCDFEQFTPCAKIFITCNNLPSVSDNSLFESDRIKMLLFNRHFPEEERDTGLKEELSKSDTRSAVLNWLLEGYKLYKEQGLFMTNPAKRLLQGYKQENDYTQQFIDEVLILYDPNDSHAQKIKFTEVLEEYREWCKKSNLKPLSRKNFKEELIRHKVVVQLFNKQDGIRGSISNHWSNDFNKIPFNPQNFG